MGSKVKLDLSKLEIPENGVILVKGKLEEMTHEDMHEAAMSVIQAVKSQDRKCNVLMVDERFTFETCTVAELNELGLDRIEDPDASADA